MPSSATAPGAHEAALAVLETVPMVMRAIRARMREARPESISVPQFRAMLYVRRHPRTDLSALAEHLGTSLPAASELVARLVRLQLVVREPDPDSRRRICLTLSVSGREHLDAAEAGTTEWLEEVLGRLDAAGMATLVEGLQQVRAVLIEQEGPAPLLP